MEDLLHHGPGQGEPPHLRELRERQRKANSLARFAFGARSDVCKLSLLKNASNSFRLERGTLQVSAATVALQAPHSSQFSDAAAVSPSQTFSTILIIIICIIIVTKPDCLQTGALDVGLTAEGQLERCSYNKTHAEVPGGFCESDRCTESSENVIFGEKVRGAASD